ncbi:MAG: mechanosensitive ion channel [Rikenellaceae bacterium]
MGKIEILSLENLISGLITIGEKLILGFIVLAIGLFIAKKISSVASKIMEKKGFDKAVLFFLRNMIGILLKIMVIISAAQIVGIEMTSFIAILGAAGLAVGMSLKGTLSNFAGGIIVLFSKPYRIGDYVEYSGYAGTIKEIQLFSTIMVTSDLKTVIIPNGEISTSTLINYSKEPIRRLDFVFDVGYDEDTDRAKEVILKAATADTRIEKSPAPFIAVSELAESTVKISLRLWVKTDDYWDLNYVTIDRVKKALDDNKISIPYPQQDIHIYNH